MKLRLAVLLIAVAVWAAPAFAQFMPREAARITPEEGWSAESSYSNGQYMDNPCTAVQDWVWVDYSAYASGLQPEKGVNSYLFDESTNMGGLYAASGASSSDIGYGSPVALRKYYKVNTGDAFHVVTVINFNPSTQSMTLTLETACGDGTPDSKE
jgi:hypothetical protein